MKIGILTSSRADFGIYLPLLSGLKKDPYFDLEIIAFGTHLSQDHGYTIDEIINAGFDVQHKIESPMDSDTPEELSSSIAKTIDLFSVFWAKYKFDTILTLGDRYEMFAAVSAASPFNLNIGHIHAGETTLGAIDNGYRHSISLFSKQLFVTTDVYKNRAKQIVEDHIPVHNVGALSIDNLSKVNFLSKDEFKSKFDIDLNKPTILSTFHPETVSFEKNEHYIDELLMSFTELLNNYQIVITMPNTDTKGQKIRDKINKYKQINPQLLTIESFGMLGYLSCMKHSSFLLGNTSSGFVEAAYFPKYVINLGDRQRGRIETENVLTIPIKKDTILKTVKMVEKLPELQDINIYGKGETANNIIAILKDND